jgi:hypothetical protein
MMRFTVLSLTLSILVNGVAWACSCIPDDRTPEQLLADYSLVAWGKVHTSAQTASGSFTYTVELEVEEGFVGAEAGDLVSFEVTERGSECGVDLGEGEQWLVFTNANEPVSLCNPSQPATEGDPLLEALREAQPQRSAGCGG